MNTNIIKMIEKDNLRLTIKSDDIPVNPREDENFGKMVCFHYRYNIGDKHSFTKALDFIKELAAKNMSDDIRYYTDDDGGEVIVDFLETLEFKELMDLAKETNIILPIFLYDHSGITINTTGFSCQWDSGQIGWIYCPKEKFLKETGFSEEELFQQNKAQEYLKDEVKLYDYYLRGDVYGYILEKKKVCESCGHIEWEELDSCWGFYGLEGVNTIKNHLAKEYKYLLKEVK